MYERNGDVPTPLTSIDDISSLGTDSKPIKTFIGQNLGFRTLNATIPMHEFYSMSEVANQDQVGAGEEISQRPLNLPHAMKLAIYILKGLVESGQRVRIAQNKEESQTIETFSSILGKQPYLSLQPLVCNLRTCAPNGKDLQGRRIIDKESEESSGFRVLITQQDILWVIDGQHRRHAMKLVFDFLEYIRTHHSLPKKQSLMPIPLSDDGKKCFELSHAEMSAWEEVFSAAKTWATVNVDIHLGLDTTCERQMFHDLNKLGKTVDASLALQFDSSNPLNRFIKEVLIDDLLGWEIVDKEIKDWSMDSGAFVRKNLVAINAHLFLNKTNINGATPDMIDSRIPQASRFWEAVKLIPHLGQPSAKKKTVAAQPVVLKALAKLYHDFYFLKNRDSDAEKYGEKLLREIPNLDFSHENPMWRYYLMDEKERISTDTTGLMAYLPSDDEGFNRDIGGFDQEARVMRFGNNHNDIFPIIGDMIRWKLQFPRRELKKRKTA